MSQPLCFTCKTRPAGNDYAGPHSAYCAECQSRDTRPQPRGSQCGCAACGRIFATLTDFGRHQETYPRGHPLEGVFTGRCFDPESLGLELGPLAMVWAGEPPVLAPGPADGPRVWGTPAGNASRARAGERIRLIRSR